MLSHKRITFAGENHTVARQISAKCVGVSSAYKFQYKHSDRTSLGIGIVFKAKIHTLLKRIIMIFIIKRQFIRH